MRYIDGMAIESVNPSNGERLQAFAPDSDAVIEEKLARATATFADWRRRPVRERAGVLTRVAEILDADRQAFARLMTLEMGAARRGPAEAQKCAVACH